jgi:hypothetical protein
MMGCALSIEKYGTILFKSRRILWDGHGDHTREANNIYTGCLERSFTTLKAYINVFRAYVQCFELS